MSDITTASLTYPITIFMIDPMADLMTIPRIISMNIPMTKLLSSLMTGHDIDQIVKIVLQGEFCTNAMFWRVIVQMSNARSLLFSHQHFPFFSCFYLSLVANYAANVTLEFTNDSVNAVAGVPLSNIATSLTLGFCWKHFAEFKDHCYVRLAQVEGKLRCAETNEKYLVRGSN